MKPLYTQIQFEKAKPTNKLPCECYHCKNIFYQTKHEIQRVLNPNTKRSGKFCSKECQSKSKTTKQQVYCKQCDKKFYKLPKEIKKSTNHFCSQSCSGTYNNTHKIHGTRRSKLEKYLDEQLISIYPKLTIDFNKKDTINSELDIYIPSLKLAFELNGIFHYEPIFGPEKLSQIQNNDQRKFQACLEKNIELVLINSSSMKNFKKHKADTFLNIIIEIINSKI